MLSMWFTHAVPDPAIYDCGDCHVHCILAWQSTVSGGLMVAW